MPGGFDNVFRADSEGRCPGISIGPTEGLGSWCSPADFKLIRNLRPAIVHTRNLPSLEFQVIAALAGVQARVHGEHGRDMYDLDGANIKYNLLRKAVRPFVSQYTAVSMDLARWLVDIIGVRPDRVNQIYNGVDIVKFNPRGTESVQIYPEGFLDRRVLWWER